MFLKIVKVIVFPFLKLFWRYKVTYEAPLPKDGPVVLASKHISALDAIVLVETYNRPIRFMAKAELFKVPVLKSLIKAFGAFPVRRGQKDLDALKASLTILKNGEVLGIMPEGHRIHSIENMSLKTGALNLASKSKAVILPVGLYTKNYTVRLFRKIEIRYGRPIPYEEYAPAGSTKEDLIAATDTVLKKEIYRLSQKDYTAESSR